MMRLLLIAVAFFAAVMALPSSADATQVPGPSLALFDAPYYTCVKNYYVATTGSDTNGGTSPATPWKTLQHANNLGRTAGDCVNVAPGTYANGVLINSGGNLASSTGYVVYRCTTMDACIVTDVAAGGENGSFAWNFTQPMGGSYVIIDGFTLSAAAETQYGEGIQISNGTNAFTRTVHHVWILNSIISGYGQSGAQMNNGEYFFVVHNTIYNNSRVGCGAQGSGISFASPIAFPGYTPTADDLQNPILGHLGPTFHNAVEWNVLYNNALTGCGTTSNAYDTDGNNIIMDTFNWDFISSPVPYTGGVLIAFNVTYNAGGAGISVFLSEDITVANNTCYNNYLDPANGGSSRACIELLNSTNDTVFNNIAVGVPAAHSGCAYSTVPFARFNSAIIGAPPSTSYTPDTFSNNITYLAGAGCQAEDAVFNGDTYSCTANKCATSPGWVSVGTKSTGTETTTPSGVNFALEPGSPAIGYGLTASYLPHSSVDAGACSSSLQVCP
jgi:hypothetical protein